MPRFVDSFKKNLRNFIFSNDLHSFINYSIYSSKLTGFFPFNEQSKLVIFHAINFFIYIVIIITCYYLAYTKCINYYAYKWRLSKYMDIAELTVGFTTLSLCMISLFRGKYLLVEIFATVSHLEKSLFTNGAVKYCHLYVLKQNFFVLFCIIIKYNARRILQPDDVLRTGLLFVTLSLDLALLAIHFVNGPFIAFLYAIKIHFVNLNQYLANFDTSKDFMLKFKIDYLLNVYQKIFKTSLALNELYSNVTLLTCACASLIILKNAYSACYVYLAFEVENPRRTYHIVIKLQYIALWFFEICLIVHSSTQLTKQNLIFNDALSDLWNRKVDQLSGNRKLEIHLAFKPLVKINGCNFMSLDYNLVSSVFSTTTTYVVILMQFGVATDNQKL